MQSKSKIVRVSIDDSRLKRDMARLRFPGDATFQMQHDAHLLSAALKADSIVISLDETSWLSLRRRFSADTRDRENHVGEPNGCNQLAAAWCGQYPPLAATNPALFLKPVLQVCALNHKLAVSEA